MAINDKTFSAVNTSVTALNTTEASARTGLTDTITQVDANEVKLARVTDGDLDKLNDVTATATELNVLDGVDSSLTVAELNYLVGVTSNIQDQLNDTGVVSIADDPPNSPSDGDIWYDSGETYRAYVYSDTAQAWLDANPPGEGTFVEANPTGTPTLNVTKLTIEDSDYNIRAVDVEDDSIDSDAIADDAVVTAAIKDDAVTVAKILTDNSGDSDQILTRTSTGMKWAAAPTSDMFSNIEYFTSSSSWTAPTGVTQVLVFLVAGGGGSSTSGDSGEGGGGGRGLAWVTDITPGTSYSYTIGSGGAAGAGNNAVNGSATSMFGLSCSGGNKGTFSPNANGAAGSFNDTTPDSGLSSITTATGNAAAAGVNDGLQDSFQNVYGSLGFMFSVLGIDANDSFTDLDNFYSVLGNRGKGGGVAGSGTSGAVCLVY